jgi:hypothetical protein
LASESDEVFDESDKYEQHCVECIAIDDHIGARSDEITCKKGDHLFLFHVDHDGFWRVMLAYTNGPRLMVGLMPKSKIEIIDFDVKSIGIYSFVNRKTLYLVPVFFLFFISMVVPGTTKINLKDLLALKKGI